MTESAQDTYVVTGAAGFIGAYVCKKLLAEGNHVVGIDNLNDYYPRALKEHRLSGLTSQRAFDFHYVDLLDEKEVDNIFEQASADYVIHLAAQAGVRHSLERPRAYLDSNLTGFFNVLEACRRWPPRHLVYASSSSVYGANQKVPFLETDRVDHPVSFYAATKRANELMAHSYSSNFDLKITGLRFFTVYGPQGRPDMAYYSFTDKYFSGHQIKVYNNGDTENDLYRDFTYIDDVVEGVTKVAVANLVDRDFHRVYNIGNQSPVRLTDFISCLEQSLGNKLGRVVSFEKKFEPLQQGDVKTTYASTDLLDEFIGFHPSTPLARGLQKFADWYVDFHRLH